MIINLLQYYLSRYKNVSKIRNKCLAATIGVDTAENEPLEVWGENSIQYSIVSLITPLTGSEAKR